MESVKAEPGMLSKIKALNESVKAELKEAVALLHAERESKDQALAQLNEKEEAVATLSEQLSAERSQRQEERKQWRRRILDASSPVSTEPLDRDNPDVQKVDNILSKSSTMNRCWFSVDVHEDTEVLLEAVVGDQTKVGGKTLFQKVVEEGVVYWSYMVDGATWSRGRRNAANFFCACRWRSRMRTRPLSGSRPSKKVRGGERTERECEVLSNPFRTLCSARGDDCPPKSSLDGHEETPASAQRRRHSPPTPPVATNIIYVFGPGQGWRG